MPAQVNFDFYESKWIGWIEAEAKAAAAKK